MALMPLRGEYESSRHCAEACEQPDRLGPSRENPQIVDDYEKHSEAQQRKEQDAHPGGRLFRFGLGGRVGGFSLRSALGHARR